MVIMWHIYISLFDAYFTSTYSIQFILDIELIKIESSGRAFQLNLNVLKLILKGYCIFLSFKIHNIHFLNFSTIVVYMYKCSIIFFFVKMKIGMFFRMYWKPLCEG